MKKKRKAKNRHAHQTAGRGEAPRGNFLRQCGKVLLLTASYQIFSVGMSVTGLQCPAVKPDGSKSYVGAISSGISSLVTEPADAQIRGKCVGGCIGCTGCTSCTGCTGCTGSTGRSSSYSPPVAVYDPVAQQQTEGRNLNEQGVVYYKNKDWARAAEHFRAALAKWPENTTIRSNLANAEEALRQERAEKERERQEAQTAEEMRKSINSMSSAFTSPSPSASGLDFAGKPAAPSSPGGLDFMSGAAHTKPAAPPNAGERKVGSLKGNRAIQEAESNLSSTQQGEPGAVFDTRGKKGPGSTEGVPASSVSQTLQMSERAMKDPRMIREQKELADLQAKRRTLDDERARLTIERNKAADPQQMKQLTRKLDTIEKEYQGTLAAESSKTQKIEKLKRTIDTEVEKPSPVGQGAKAGTE